MCVTQPLFESRMNWIYDLAPSAPCRATVDYSDTPVHSSNTHVNSRDPPVLTSDTQASAIDISVSSGAPLALPPPKKSRRRRNRRSANKNSAPRWPRMSTGPIGIRHPREWLSINQLPVTPPRWWVPQCTKAKASTPLIYHSLPFQQPIEIQHSSLAWTTVDFQGFISRPFQTPARIWLPPLPEWTTQDLASPHLLCCNPAPNPSLDGLLGLKWLVLHERLGKL